MAEEPTMNDLLTAFGVEQKTKETQETQEPQETQDPPEEPQTGETTEEPTSETEETPEEKPEETKEEPPEQPPEQKDKLNQAFAQMRIENKNMKNLMKGIGEVLGVQSDDPQQLQTALQDALVNAKAQQQNIDPKILQELETLKNKHAEYEQEEIRRDAYLGFQRIKDDFGLEDKSLQNFADQLVAEGVNPFEQRVDVKREYIIRNYDKLMQEAEQRGIEKEAQRSKKAETHGTKPSDKTGQTHEDPAKITSISELNKYFKDQGLTE